MSTNVAPAEEKVRGRAGPGVGPSIPQRRGEREEAGLAGGGPKPPCPRRPGPPAPPGVTKTKKKRPRGGAGRRGPPPGASASPPPPPPPLSPLRAAPPRPPRAPAPARPDAPARRARPGASGAPGEKKNHLRSGWGLAATSGGARSGRRPSCAAAAAPQAARWTPPSPGCAPAAGRPTSGCCAAPRCRSWWCSPAPRTAQRTVAAPPWMLLPPSSWTAPHSQRCWWTLWPVTGEMPPALAPAPELPVCTPGWFSSFTVGEWRSADGQPTDRWRV